LASHRLLIWSDGVGRTTTTLQIAQDHVFDPYGPLPSLGHLKPEFASDDIRLPVFAIVYGILANTQLVKPADEPKSWLDLVDPRWKGKILSDDFRALGDGGVLFYATENCGVNVATTEWLARQGVVHFGVDSMRPGPDGKVELADPQGLLRSRHHPYREPV
jgi:ABC-type thiamine transport system substrate-binding protein